MAVEIEHSLEDRDRINKENLRQDTLKLIAKVAKAYHWEEAEEAQVITHYSEGTNAIRFRRILQGRGPYEIRTLTVREPKFQIEAYASTNPNDLQHDFTYKSGGDKFKGIEAVVKANEILGSILPQHEPHPTS